ncbi:MAG: hypothetical protein EHM13_14105 [Acidobacteria bacterium]|nr:MAG: hypothetical protein EHM13_14105 [Acidobacteriota bacterium]
MTTWRRLPAFLRFAITLDAAIWLVAFAVADGPPLGRAVAGNIAIALTNVVAALTLPFWIHRA